MMSHESFTEEQIERVARALADREPMRTATAWEDLHDHERGGFRDKARAALAAAGVALQGRESERPCPHASKGESRRAGECHRCAAEAGWTGWQSEPAPSPNCEKLIEEVFPFDGSDPSTVIEVRARVRTLIAALAAGVAPQEPSATEWSVQIANERARQIHLGYTSEHDDAQGADALLGNALDYMRRGEVVKSAALVEAARSVMMRARNGQLVAGAAREKLSAEMSTAAPGHCRIVLGAAGRRDEHVPGCGHADGRIVAESIPAEEIMIDPGALGTGRLVLDEEWLADVLREHDWYEATNSCICGGRPVDMDTHRAAKVTEALRGGGR